MKNVHLLPVQFRIAVAAVALATTCMAQANLFIYKGPRGETLFSNIQEHRRGYRLIKESKTEDMAGHFATGRKQNAASNITMLTTTGSRSGWMTGGRLVNTTLYDDYIRKAARKHGVEPALVKAVIQVESNFDPSAVSSAGARGLMQLMPGTAARYALGLFEMFSPENNIDAGVQHLAYLETLFPNNTDFVLAAYNAGENNVVRYSGIPPFPETVNYVQKVNRSKKLFQYAFL